MARMRHRLRIFFAGGLISALVVLLLMSRVNYPILQLLPEGLRLYATAGCSSTAVAMQEIRRSPALFNAVLVIPSEAEDEPFSSIACDLFGQQLADRGSWLRFLPSRFLCRKVANEAAVFHALNFVSSPAWARGMEPLVGVKALADIASLAEAERISR